MNVNRNLTALCLLAALPSAAVAKDFAPPVLVGKRVEREPADANGSPSFYPTQIQQAYGLSSLLASGSNGGAGQTVAIIDAYHYPNALSTLNTFSAGYQGNWSLPTMNSSGSGPLFAQLSQTGGTLLSTATNSGWAGETALDIEYVHTMAPQANIILYEANSASDNDLFAAITAAKNNPAVSVVTMSWGGSESGTDPSFNTYFTTPGTKAAQNLGVTFCASTGDSGAPGGYPAFSPNVVAVGGTSLHLNTNNSYNSETAWSWNSTQSWGGGGGTSTVETKPDYQTSFGTLHGGLLATTTSRATPDVSLVADPSTGVWVYDSLNGGWFNFFGGTSLASPLFAGLVADANGIRAAAGHGTLDGPTQTLPALYSLGGDFHDITSGNISPTGDPNYSATVGYDLATGLGSPIGSQLVLDLANYGLVLIPYHWASAVSGSWSTSANWTVSVPNAIGVAAVINAPTNSQLTVTLDEPVTLGALLLGNSASSAAGYTLNGSGANALVWNNSGSGARITVTDGTHAINAPVVLNDNLLVTSGGTSSWTLSFGTASSITDNGGGFSLTMSGTGGTLVLGGSNTYTGGTTVSAGTLVAASPYALNAHARLTIAAAGTVTLGANSLITNDPNSGMSGGVLLAANHDVGYSGTGTFTQSAGKNSLSNGLYIGYNGSDSGTYSLVGGLLSPASLFVGLSGTGLLSQSGGTNAVALFITLGNSPGSSGTYGLSGGQFSALYETVGYAGSGNFMQSGGTNSANMLALGQIAGSAASYHLMGGLLRIGGLIQGNGSAAFNFSGGTLQPTSNFATSVPIALSTAGSNGLPVIDLAGVSSIVQFGGLSLGGGTLVVQSAGSSGGVQLGGDVTASATSAIVLAAGSGGIPTLVLAGTNGVQNLRAATTPATTLTLPSLSISASTVNVSDNTGSYNGIVVFSGSTSLTAAAPTLNVLGGTLDVIGTLSGGTLQVNTGATLSVLGDMSGSAVMLAGGGLVAATSGASAINLGALSGSGTATNSQSGAATTFSVGSLNESTTFSGTLLDGSGISALTKVGTGTLVLSGTNSYLGGTMVVAGKLRVTNVDALADGSNLTVGNAAYFAPVAPAVGAVAVPEPSTLALLFAGAIGLLIRVWLR
jgi:autotransporter-associated beta strand protein